MKMMGGLIDLKKKKTDQCPPFLYQTVHSLSRCSDKITSSLCVSLQWPALLWSHLQFYSCRFYSQTPVPLLERVSLPSRPMLGNQPVTIQQRQSAPLRQKKCFLMHFSPLLMPFFCFLGSSGLGRRRRAPFPLPHFPATFSDHNVPFIW